MTFAIVTYVANVVILAAFGVADWWADRDDETGLREPFPLGALLVVSLGWPLIVVSALGFLLFAAGYGAVSVLKSFIGRAPRERTP